MGAGESARDVARDATAAAEALRKRADWADRRAASFRAGAAGEEALARALAPLAAEGWLALPDRRSPRGGNLDQIIVGPAGVAVIDAKNWSFPVTVESARVFTGTWDRTKALDSISGQVELVRDALKDLGYAVAVSGFLALAGKQDRNRQAESVRDVWLVGLHRLEEGFRRLGRQLDASRVEQVFRSLSVAFPPHSSGQAERAAGPSEVVSTREHRIFDRTTRFFYIHEWRRSRLYLTSADGDGIGWKNLNTGEIEVTCDDDNGELARAILSSATSTGVALAAEHLPKVPLGLPGGKVLSRLGRLWTAVVIGQEWVRRDTRRLYGTLIDPSEGTFVLGYADLRTGELHPSVNGNLNPNLRSAETYLRLLVDRRPARGQAERERNYA